MESAEGRKAGLRTDSVVDGQTLVTIPRTEVLARLGSFPAETMARIDRALADSPGLPPPAVRR
jgi:mRNA-degrading endonuclease toxin of MazEF toxin-antitoxin module